MERSRLTLTVQAAVFCSAPWASSQRGADLAGCSVVEPAVGPVVVVVDVGGYHLPGLVEGLELLAPDGPFLEVAKPALDERLALGVAVAAAAVTDTKPGHDEPCRAGAERGAVIGAECQHPWSDALFGDGPFDHRDRFLGAAADGQVPADDLAGAAIDDLCSGSTSRARRPTRWSYPDAIAVRDARPRRTRGGAGAAQTGGAGSACARASRAAPACG